MITTLRGETAVEGLIAGDRVVTRDNGLQTVKKVARRDYDFGQLQQVPHLRPVLLVCGAMEAGLPERDMLVSPNLRVLVRQAVGGLFLSGNDQLVSAKRLKDGKTIRDCSVLGVSYVHIEFGRHEVILANGVWVEAHSQKDLSLGAAANAQRLELAEVLGALVDDAARDGAAL